MSSRDTRSPETTLRVVRIAFSTGMAPIAADKASLVVGRTAAVSLLRGTLLSTTELTSRRGPVHGQAVVGVATDAGQLPAGGVAVGDTVDVILTGSPSTLTGGASDGSVAAGSPRPQVNWRSAVFWPRTSLSPELPALRPRVPTRLSFRCWFLLRWLRWLPRLRGGAGGPRVGGIQLMSLVAVCSGKGPPGVSTLTCVAGAVWPPQRRIVVR